MLESSFISLIIAETNLSLVSNQPCILNIFSDSSWIAHNSVDLIMRHSFLIPTSSICLTLSRVMLYELPISCSVSFSHQPSQIRLEIIVLSFSVKLLKIQTKS